MTPEPVQLDLFPIPRIGVGKRVVLVCEDGVDQILGLSISQPAEVLYIPLGNEMVMPINLFKATPRAYFYREISAPVGFGSFNPNQQ